MQSRGIRSLGLIVVGALALAVGGGMALTHATVPDAMTWDWHDGHVAGWDWGMVLFGLLWTTLLVALSTSIAYWLATRSRTDGRTENSALAVLRERYARGEIDDEEFERRRARLTPDNNR